MEMINEIMKTMDTVNELKEQGFSQEQAMQLITAYHIEHAANAMGNVSGWLYKCIDGFEDGAMRTESDPCIDKRLDKIADALDSISDTIDRLGDNLTNSIDAIEEDIRTGKAFVKGEISTYNLN